ncbi:MAG: hypothetical protein K2K37_01575 [Muribaculaceae bacterium]|nr:hypothetical protein [Muribaculaceae bacterium]
MEDKKITPQESMELIANMIANTREQLLTRGAGNMLLFWGYLCVAVALLSYLYTYLHLGKGIDIPFSPQLIWWLIPVIGIPYTLYARRRKALLRNVSSYTDRLTASLWNYVLWLALAAFVVGALFLFSGFRVWYIMMLFAFFVVGMAVSMQGMIIREKSLILGGAFSVISGGFIVAGMIAGVYWLWMFSSPLFIISFIVMMIIPGHILNRKAARNR